MMHQYNTLIINGLYNKIIIYFWYFTWGLGALKSPVKVKTIGAGDGVVIPAQRQAIGLSNW
jgi:hypothetical protein